MVTLGHMMIIQTPFLTIYIYIYTYIYNIYIYIYNAHLTSMGFEHSVCQNTTRPTGHHHKNFIVTGGLHTPTYWFVMYYDFVSTIDWEVFLLLFMISFYWQALSSRTAMFLYQWILRFIFLRKSNWLFCWWEKEQGTVIVL